jgi:predicted DNA-binding protein YlxM (UPF0122 family)
MVRGAEISKHHSAVFRVKKYHSKHAGMKHALELYNSGNYTVKEITEITSVSRSALYRALKEEEKAKELLSI